MLAPLRVDTHHVNIYAIYFFRESPNRSKPPCVYLLTDFVLIPYIHFGAVAMSKLVGYYGLNGFACIIQKWSKEVEMAQLSRSPVGRIGRWNHSLAELPQRLNVVYSRRDLPNKKHGPMKSTKILQQSISDMASKFRPDTCKSFAESLLRSRYIAVCSEIEIGHEIFCAHFRFPCDRSSSTSGAASVRNGRKWSAEILSTSHSL